MCEDSWDQASDSPPRMIGFTSPLLLTLSRVMAVGLGGGVALLLQGFTHPIDQASAISYLGVAGRKSGVPEVGPGGCSTVCLHPTVRALFGGREGGAAITGRTTPPAEGDLLPIPAGVRVCSPACERLFHQTNLAPISKITDLNPVSLRALSHSSTPKKRSRGRIYQITLAFLATHYISSPHSAKPRFEVRIMAPFS